MSYRFGLLVCLTFSAMIAVSSAEEMEVLQIENCWGEAPISKGTAVYVVDQLGCVVPTVMVGNTVKNDDMGKYCVTETNPPIKTDFFILGLDKKDIPKQIKVGRPLNSQEITKVNEYLSKEGEANAINGVAADVNKDQVIDLLFVYDRLPTDSDWGTKFGVLLGKGKGNYDRIAVNRETGTPVSSDFIVVNYHREKPMLIRLHECEGDGCRNLFFQFRESSLEEIRAN